MTGQRAKALFTPVQVGATALGQRVVMAPLLTPAEWLQKHSAVSGQDFAKEPLCNPFAILVCRSSHLAYHLGQVAHAPK